MITRLEIEGFKSFGSERQCVDLGPLTFLVGSNGSGKTNFLKALRFLQASLQSDVTYAANELGGLAEIRSKLERKRKADKPLRIRLMLDDVIPLRQGANDDAHLAISGFDYSVTINARTDDDVPTITNETLRAKTAFHGEERAYRLDRNAEKLKIQDPPSSNQEFPVPATERSRPAISAGFFSLPALAFKGLVDKWQFYNISPQVARASYPELPDTRLGTHGENLSAVLHKLESGNGGRQLDPIAASLRGVIPGFESVTTIKADLEGRWSLKVVESKIRSGLIPASVSDGTIRLIALMVIAQLGMKKNGGLIAIEEPENGVHPHVFEQLIDVFRETSGRTQILATTHNPMFLDYLEPTEVLLVGKKDGFTRLRRPDELREIEVFRKHFSLGELWVQGTFDGILE